MAPTIQSSLTMLCFCAQNFQQHRKMTNYIIMLGYTCKHLFFCTLPNRLFHFGSKVAQIIKLKKQKFKKNVARVVYAFKSLWVMGMHKKIILSYY